MTARVAKALEKHGGQVPIQHDTPAAQRFGVTKRGGQVATVKSSRPSYLTGRLSRGA